MQLSYDPWLIIPSIHSNLFMNESFSPLLVYSFGSANIWCATFFSTPRCATSTSPSCLLGNQRLFMGTIQAGRWIWEKFRYENPQKMPEDGLWEGRNNKFMQNACALLRAKWRHRLKMGSKNFLWCTFENQVISAKWLTRHFLAFIVEIWGFYFNLALQYPMKYWIWVSFQFWAISCQFDRMVHKLYF